MATAVIEKTTELVPANNAAAAVVLFDSEKFDAFYAKLKAEIEATPVDLATDKGRKAIASAAAKVRTEKASIDRDRKRLTQEWRDNTALVNGAWKGIEARLDDLAVEARKPLTEWEAAEATRLDRCNSVISDIHGAAIVTLEDTSETVRERGMRIWAIEIGEDFRALANEAEQAKSATIATLQAAMARLKAEEADKAELQRLRDEAAARAEADRIAAEKVEAEQREAARIEAERAATEQAAQEAAERAQAEQERQAAAEKAEADRIERAKVEAAQQAQREAEQAARAEQDRRDREHAAQLAEAQAERDRIAKIEADRQAEADRLAAEQAKRDRNRAHRSQIMGQAKIAIMAAANEGRAVEHPITEAAAVAIVKAIVNGVIPNVTLRF